MAGQQREYLIAVDLGAESGRVVLGHFDGDRLALEEVHRFPTGGVRLPTSLHWDALRLFTEVCAGIAQAQARCRRRALSVGVDAWGVDFALLDHQGRLLGQPYCYRDERALRAAPTVFQRVSRAEVFAATGCQMMPMNSLYQLVACRQERSPDLEAAATFLMIPDLIHYWLCGERACEYTIATTSQCYDLRGRNWAWELLARLELPTRIFPPVVPPATRLGTLGSWVSEELGIPPIAVVAPAAHDTGSAVAGTPLDDPAGTLFISSGTWALVGVEITGPLVNPDVFELGFGNEGGPAGTNRLLRNVMGLWLVQECRRAWAAEGASYSYDELEALAEAAPPFRAVINPDAAAFLPPGNMPARIAAACRASGQPVPTEPGSVVRVCLESLALRCRWVLERAERLLGRPLHQVHLVGGGARSRLFCQLIANACRRPVLAGPVEATAYGNLALQLMAAGRVGSLAEARDLIRRSSPPVRYEPQAGLRWEAHYARWRELLATMPGFAD